MMNFKTFLLSLLVLFTAIVICYALCESAYQRGYYQGKLDELQDYVKKQHKLDSMFLKQSERLHSTMDENYELKQQLNNYYER